MRNASKVTITTSADGRENTIVRDGEMELSLQSAFLSYREENAIVMIKFQGDYAEIERQGDYTLRLNLKRNEITKGSIGLGGSEGEIQVITRKLSYSVTKDALLASLHYDLLFGAEIQSMKLRLLSRFQERKDDED